ADACDLRLRLSSAPDHPERCRAFASEVLRRYRTGRAGAQASQIVGFDQRNELRSVDSEEGDDERGSVTGRSVCLDARVAQLEIGGRHVREPPLQQSEPTPGRDL